MVEPAKKWVNLVHDNELYNQWREVLKVLEVDFGHNVCKAWFERLNPSWKEDTCVYLKTSTRFNKDRITTDYSDAILKAWKQVDKTITRIQIFCGVSPKIQKNKELKELEDKEDNLLVQLPLWPEPTRGVPNAIIRGCLFNAIHGKYAKFLERKTILKEKNLTILFTGKQLTQSDLSVWEQILHLAREQCLGYDVYFTANRLLKSLGKNNGKKDHEFLKTTLSRLNACSVEITHNGITFMGSLINGGCRDEKHGQYKLSINPQIARLYNEGFTLTNWEDRKAIGNRPLAQWLHHYISSHAQIYPTKVSTFHRLSGSNTKLLRRFKSQLKDALQYLLNMQFIKSFSIDKDLVSIENFPTKSQEKHLKIDSEYGIRGTKVRDTRYAYTGYEVQNAKK